MRGLVIAGKELSSSCSDDDDEDKIPSVPPLKLKCDTYDGLMMAVACLFDDEYVHHHGGRFPVRMQFCMHLGKHLTAVFLQFTLVFMLYSTSVAEQAEEFSDVEQRMSLLRGNLAADPALKLDMSVPLESRIWHFCVKDNTLSSAHLVVLALWFLKMMSEIAQVSIRSHIIMSVPAPPERGVTFSLEKDAKSQVTGRTISYMNPCQRILCIVLVMVPHVLLTLAVGWTGARFLMITQRMTVLIFKAVGLAYILTIDEMLFDTLTPYAFKYAVGITKYDYAHAFEKTCMSYNWTMWGNSLFKVFTIMTLALLTQRVLLGEVGEMRHMCGEYLEEFPTDECYRCGVSSGELLTTFLTEDIWGISSHDFNVARLAANTEVADGEDADDDS